MQVLKQFTCEFLFFQSLRVPQKFCDIKYPFAFFESFGISCILSLSINLRPKVTRVFSILNKNGID